VADLDGDSIPDFVTANTYSDNVSVRLGNGDGSFRIPFETPASFVVGNGPASVAVADVDGGGVPDLVIANFFSDDVSVWRGNGDASFQVAAILVVGDGPISIAVADLNDDALVDIISANRNSDDVSVFFVTPEPTPTATPTATPTPEPSLLLQFASGLLGLMVLGKRRRGR
jgi:hypothetical protein